MYDSASCSYAGALELKGASGAAGAAAAGVTAAGVKQENWPYRGLTCGSTFQRLKESVDKAKQALADRGGYLAGAFSPPPRANPSAISPTASITGKRTSPRFFLSPRGLFASSAENALERLSREMVGFGEKTEGGCTFCYFVW